MTRTSRMVIFDFDGTIVDSMLHLENLAVRALTRYIHEIPTERLRQIYKDTSGRPFCEQVDQIIPHKSIEFRKKIVADYEQMKEITILDQSMFIDTKEILQYLKEKGYYLCISSSSQKNMITRFFAQHELLILFSEILGYEENFAKGSDHFSYLITKYGIHPEEMIFIGDSLEDKKCANDNNISFVAKTGTFTRTDFMETNPCKYIVSTLNELKLVL